MTGIRMNSELKYWRPDQIAECIDGINEEAYGVLWSFVPEYDHVQHGEQDDRTSMKRFWKRIPTHIRKHINERAKEAITL